MLSSDERYIRNRYGLVTLKNRARVLRSNHGAVLRGSKNMASERRLTSCFKYSKIQKNVLLLLAAANEKYMNVLTY